MKPTFCICLFCDSTVSNLREEIEFGDVLCVWEISTISCPGLDRVWFFVSCKF